MSDLPVVGIVGLGLIGGSLARALRAGQHRVVATTRSPDARTGARALGVDVVDGVVAVVEGSDIVVVATSLAVLPDAVAEVATLAAKAEHRPTVTDVGSVKAPIAAVVPAGARELFVGGHPMAGTEHSGWAAGDAEMFRGRTWALALDEATDVTRWAAVACLAVAAGSTVVPVDPAEHDAAVALTSHLPYVLAAVAAGGAEQGRHPELMRSLAAGSFDSLTRVAGGHPTLGQEMAIENRDQLATAIRSARLALERVEDDLLDGRDDAVAEVFDAGRRGRQRLVDAARPAPPTTVSLGSTGLVDLGRRGGRVVAVHAVTGAEVEVDVTVPGEPS